MEQQMKCVVGFLLAVGTIGAAAAATIAPANAAYTATGKISFSKSIINANCSIDVAGRVSADGRSASVDKVVFRGESYKCARVTATALPWLLTPTSETTGSISGIRVNVRAPLVGGDCGPATVDSTWSNQLNQLQAANVPIGPCTIKTVSIQPTPAFHVSP